MACSRACRESTTPADQLTGTPVTKRIYTTNEKAHVSICSLVKTTTTTPPPSIVVNKKTHKRRRHPTVNNTYVCSTAKQCVDATLDQEMINESTDALTRISLCTNQTKSIHSPVSNDSPLSTAGSSSDTTTINEMHLFAPPPSDDNHLFFIYRVQQFLRTNRLVFREFGKLTLKYKTTPIIPFIPRATLVLDLDETLVHTTLIRQDGTVLTQPEQYATYNNGTQKNPSKHGEQQQNSHLKSDFKFPMPHLPDIMVSVCKRPGCDEFLDTVSQMYEVVVFTASVASYADAVINYLDPHGTRIHHRIYRDSCTPCLGSYFKDLRILGRPLSRILLVDNTPSAYALQYNNGVPIKSYYDDESDDELTKLLPFLDKVKSVFDFRTHVRNEFKTFERLVEHSDRYAHMCNIIMARAREEAAKLLARSSQ